jgi:hypothetical protein
MSVTNQKKSSAMTTLVFQHGPPCCPPPGSPVRFSEITRYEKSALLSFLYAVGLSKFAARAVKVKEPIPDAVPAVVRFSAPKQMVVSHTTSTEQEFRGSCPACGRKWNITLALTPNGDVREVKWWVRYGDGGILYSISNCCRCHGHLSCYESHGKYKDHSECRNPACSFEEWK